MGGETGHLAKVSVEDYLYGQNLKSWNSIGSGRSSQLHSDSCLPAGEAGDDGGEGVHVGLKDDIGGDTPVLPARLEIFNQLVHGPEEYVGALEDLLRTQLGPTARQLLGHLAASVRHDNPLHQRVQLEPRVSVAGDLANE